MSSILRIRRLLGGAGLMAALLVTTAQAAPPAAPVVTTGADIKQLQFDWSIVPRSNYYEFWFKANNGAPWVKFSEQLPWQPHAVNNVAVHLLDWDQARYQVKACNPSGCTASPAISVHDRMFEAIGYFKPSATYANAYFGRAAAISEDGSTLAGYASEPVPGGRISTFYVFAKMNGTWQQQRRIIPSTTAPDRSNREVSAGGPRQVSLSGDGNRLVTSVSVCSSAGDCYPMLSVWTRAGSTWTREFQNISATNDYENIVQIDEAGDRILTDRLLTGGGSRTELWQRTESGWAKQPPLPAVPGGYVCHLSRLSGDGNTLARACYVNGGVHLLLARAPAWNVQLDYALPWPAQHAYVDIAADHAGDTFAVATSSVTAEDPPPDLRSRVIVVKLAAGVPTSTVVSPGSWTPDFYTRFGRSISLSRDGTWLAVDDPGDTGIGNGVLSPPLQSGGYSSKTGAAYVFELRAAGPQLRRVIKPNGDVATTRESANELDFANNGRSLLIADPRDASNSTGVDGDREGTAVVGSAGALWLY